MTIDPYSPCPCASGKKIKFCCGASVVSDLDKIIRMVEGEQRVAAVEHLNRTLAKHGPLPCLLSLKVGVQLQLNDLEGAIKASEEYFSANPDSPDALGYAACIAAVQGDLEDAVAKLHAALRAEIEVLPQSTSDALQQIVHELMVDGSASRLYSAIGHLRMLASFTDSKDPNILGLLSGLEGSSRTPVLFKQYQTLRDCPENAPWREEFDAAIHSAAMGKWLDSLDQFTRLERSAKSADSKDGYAVVHNVAVLNGWLLRSDEAVAAWRRLAGIEGLSPDDAVEAEALALTLASRKDAEMVPELRITYTIKDLDALTERLLSDPRISSVPIDTSQMTDENEPPPKGLYWLLDKPLPEPSDDLRPEQIPVVLGEFLVYGKQTDQDARVYFTVVKSDDYWLKTTAAAEALGQLVGPAGEELVLRELPAEMVALSARWHFPDGLPLETRRRLIGQQRRDTVFEKWPEQPRGALNDKSPKEAAGDPALRNRVLALILMYELQADHDIGDIDYNLLRERLGLPRREKIDVERIDFDDPPITRIPYVDTEKLSGAQLVKLLSVSYAARYHSAAKHVGEEILRRGGIEGELDVHDVHAILSHTAQDPDEILSYLRTAQEEVVKAGRSPAGLLIRELGVRLQRLDIERCQTLIQRIQAHHLHEEGIKMALYQLLLQHGVIRPDGSPARGPAGPPPMPAAAPPPAAQTGATLWTPDGPSPATPAAENTGAEPGKSKLWIPGMD